VLNVSGMWRSVWLEATNADLFIADVFMVPDVDKSKVTAKVTLCAPGGVESSKQKIVISLKGPDGKMLELAEEVTIGSAGLPGPHFTEFSIPINLKHARLWSPDTPNLYNVEVSIARGDEKVKTRFGMRKIETRTGRFYLNNQPLYIFGGGIDPLPFGGAGDVNWFVPGPYRYPTPEENNADAKLIKSLNINYLREGLRPFQPDFLRAASEVGLLAVEENSWRTNIQTEKELLDTWSAIVLRDRNNPSVMLWTMFNEGWGYRLDWANALYDHLHKLDPTRLVCENTGGVSHYRNYPGNHKKSDIEDLHRYPGFDLFPRDYWMSHKFVKAPLLAGEFGPIPYFFNPDVYRRAWNNGDAKGKDPWWFSAYPHSETVPNPDWRKDWNHHGLDERYTAWGLDKVYGNWDKCLDAHDWYYYWGLKDQTQAMRMNPEMSGFVVWIWDNAQHGTGAITNFKTKKVFADELAKVWTPDLVVIDERRHNYWGKDRVNATLHVSHFTQKSLKGARIDYWVEGTNAKGSIPCLDIQPGQERIVGDIQLQLEDVNKVAMHKLIARLVSAKGETISENFEPIYLYPTADCIPSPITYASYLIPGHVWGALNTFGSPGNYGYKQPGLFNDVPTAKLIVTGTLDARAEEQLVNGSTVILVASEDQPLLKANGITLGGANLGGHCNSFYTKRGLGIFDRVPCDNPITWAYYRLWPQKVLEGVKPEQHEDILAGGYMNLMNHHAATMAQFKVGKGVLIVTTLDLFEAVVEDPAAVLVFNDLLDYANRGPKPNAELKPVGG
ncbi:MAG: glycoside hydrolase family 2 TIM barrel-domain containing protein, partial [Armatimonadota bacterium]